jgi:hypothetical protein
MMIDFEPVGSRGRLVCLSALVSVCIENGHTLRDSDDACRLHEVISSVFHHTRIWDVTYSSPRRSRNQTAQARQQLESNLGN